MVKHFGPCSPSSDAAARAAEEEDPRVVLANLQVFRIAQEHVMFAPDQARCRGHSSVILRQGLGLGLGQSIESHRRRDP